MHLRSKILRICSVLSVLTVILSYVQPPVVQAHGGDGLKREVNAASGRVSFIRPEKGGSLSAARALGETFLPQDPALALAVHYAPEFGLQDAEGNLSVMKRERSQTGEVTVHFQQQHEGVPVMGGELIVNTNDGGDLYSISGEVSPDLALSTQPEIDAGQARQSALEAVAKWYGGAPEDYAATDPGLWIYDESLLRSSTRPVELTWRMEVTSRAGGVPVRELVLVNAQQGGISLHFNQEDQAWTMKTNQAPSLAPEAGTLYVAPTGNDGNLCNSTSTPCATINAAIEKAGEGDTIRVAIGVFTGTDVTAVVWIKKSIILSGGWDSSFTTQSGLSTIDGQNTRPAVFINLDGVSIVTTIDHFKIQNGYHSDMGAGGIMNRGDLTLNNSYVINNTSYYGGGGIMNYGVLTINNSSISGNTSGHINSGGGFGGAGIYTNGPMTLNNTLVSNNNILGQYFGSGILSRGEIHLNNVTVNGNTGAAGIQHEWGTMTINNSTVTRNSGPYVGGIVNQTSTVILQNTIVAGNLGTTAPDCNDVTSQGHNLIGINQFTFVGGLYNQVITGTCVDTLAAGDLGGTTASPLNSKLNPLQDNGGPTFTHALKVGSPAIDAGDPATCLPTDQRGVARPVGSKCDIGAFEGSVTYTGPDVGTYSFIDYSTLPGLFLCDQTDPGCVKGDAHAKAAHKYALGTYDFYQTHFQRDSLDNKGMPILSTVHYGTNFDNAFWDGTQVVYGDAFGFPLADDVVAHELTHGVTQSESNLFYYYQSGAINESFSDLWGEYYDQTNGLGNDADGVRWLVGEDVSGLGAIRNMSNPPAFDDPDRMTSPLYYVGEEENGGIHWNSGVNNKAVSLMVDGGSFNGKSVGALGWDKVGAIYYLVNTNLLTSGADYSDLYYALQQGCASLIGQQGIIAQDCLNLKEAIDAVEMNAQPVTGYSPNAPLCYKSAPTMILADDLENGSSKWTFTKTGPANGWRVDSPYGQYAQSGQHFLYANDSPQQNNTASDASARLVSVKVPATGAYLWFAQAYDFETGYLVNDPNLYHFDGGVLEYSTTGTAWVDAGSLIDSNGYNGKIYGGTINPLKNRSGFVGASHGYISTRVNLAKLAGKTVYFRWRMGTDEDTRARGWWLDNVKVYTCSGDVTFADVPPTHPYYNDIEILYANNLTGGCATNPAKFCPDQIMNRAQAAAFMLRGNFGPSYVPPEPQHIFLDDWTKGPWAEGWAEGMRAEGFSAGCLANPLKYCPWDQIPREQAVIFALKLKYGKDYMAPAATGTVFADLTNPNYYATSWAETAYKEGIISNCGTTGGKPNFCPKALVSRGLAAYMIVRAKNLSMP